MAGPAVGLLASLPATFTTSEAEGFGLRRRDVYRLRDEGVLLELSRGVFRKADAAETAHLDLLAVSRRAPRSVVCLVSALAIHDLTDEIPAVVQVAVPRGSYRPRIEYPTTEVSEFAAATFDLGREDFEVAPGEFVPVYGAARSVVDTMRLRSRVGDSLALRALRMYLNRPDSRPAELLTYARALDMEGPVRQAAAAVIG